MKDTLTQSKATELFVVSSKMVMKLVHVDKNQRQILNCSYSILLGKSFLFQNFNEILTRQQRAKYYTALLSGKYTPYCKSETSLLNEREKQVDRFQCLSTIVDQLNQEYPEMQTSLRNISLLLSNNNMANTERSSARGEIETD